MSCPICDKPFEYMTPNEFGGANFHHAGDPANCFCQQSSISYGLSQHKETMKHVATSLQEIGNAFSRLRNILVVALDTANKFQDKLKLQKRKELYRRRYNRRAIKA